MLLCQFLFVFIFAKTFHCQNIETRNPVVIQPSKSAAEKQLYNFGASLSAVVTKSREPVLYIGAPTYGTPVARVPPGTFYHCSTRSKTCSRKIETAKKGAIGLTVDTTSVGKDVMVCGPNYNRACKDSSNQDPWMFGTCFQANSTNSYEVPNPCEAATFCKNSTVVDIIFVLDESGSVQLFYFNKALRWVNTVTAQFRNEINSGHVRVGVVKFSTGVQLSVPLLDRSYLSLEENVTHVGYDGGWTYTNLGIKEAVTEFQRNGRKGVPKLMVVVTDGESTSIWNTKNEARIARASNITMVAVGVGINVIDEELADIAGNEARVLKVENFNQLGSILKKLTSVIVASTTVQLEAKTSNLTSEFLNCQFGLSINSENVSSPLVGAVGSFDRVGSFARYHNKLNALPEILNLTGLEKIWWPENVTELRDSYLGYSITSGKFFGNGIPYVASGSPRYHSRGQVLIVQANQTLNPTKNYYSIKPSGSLWQLGGYFGQSVLALDINNVGFDDLLVSAPLYSDVSGYDQGRVFIYMNDPTNPGPHNWVSSSKTKVLAGNNAVGARFGMSITNVGDVDKNNYADIVIGASMEELTPDSSGAVYLYYGSAMGFSELYKQRIVGTAVSSSLVSFGYAVTKGPSEGVDLNSDSYPDLIVAAPGSDRVVTMYSRPILDVTTSIEVAPPSIDLLSCLYLQGKSCANVTVCIKAEQRAAQDIPRIEMVTTLNLDNLLPFSGVKRVVFSDTNQVLSTKTQTLRLNINKQCFTFGIKLNPTAYSPVSGAVITSASLQFNYSYHLTPAHLNRMLSPIIDPLSKTFRLVEWPVTTGCSGTNGICVHDLALSVTTSIPESSNVFIIGASPPIFIMNVTISNNGPDHSFYTKILVKSPGLRLTLVNNPCVVKSDLSVLGSSTIHINQIASVFVNNRTCDLVFKFALSDLAVTASTDLLSIEANILSVSNSSVDPKPQNNQFAFKRRIKYDVNLAMQLTSSPPNLAFNHSQDSNVVQSLTDPILGGVSTNVFLSFTIQNKGSNLLSSAWFQFSWPMSTNDGFNLLYLYDFQCTPLTSCRCDVSNKINKMNIPINKPKFPMNFTINFPTAGQAILTSLSNCASVTCGEISCQVFNQSKFEIVKVEASLKLWLPTLIHANTKSSLISSITFNASGSPIVPAVNSTLVQASTLIATWVAQSQTTPVSNKTNIGAIIGAIIGGIALLTIVCLAMWKLGFFDSKYGDLLSEAKAAQNGDPAPQTMNDISSDVTRSTADLVAG